MQYNSAILSTWDSTTIFAGETAVSGVVTVEANWYLNATGKNVGASNKGPYRWFQRSDNSQVETIVPNVRTIQIDRSIDQDSDSMTFSITNQQLQSKETAQIIPGQFGQPGYYNFDYGNGGEAQARWGQTPNSWSGILTPNALFRTYQGFGGGFITTQEELTTAVAADKLILTGTWLADNVEINSRGDLTIRCRDMAKLLIDQYLLPPLVPRDQYPLEYRRWYDEEFDTELSPAGNDGNVPLTYKDSSGDRWFGSNASIHGHRPTDSLDGNDSTWAMSVGNGHPSKSFCTDFFEYEPGGPISSVYIHPWMGNYEMYICVLENGIWQGDPNNTIFYDQTPLYTSQPSALNPDTGADTPYVSKHSVPWETGKWYDLPRQYNAQRLRITFRNHQKAKWGPFYYRCGIREIQAAGGASDGTGGLGLPQAVSIAAYDSGVADEYGYRIVDHAGKVTSFGQARDAELSTGQITPRGVETYTVDVAHMPAGTGDGYWTLDSNGIVRAYGDANYHAGSTYMHDDLWLGHETNFALIDAGPPREVMVNESGARADITDLPLYYRAIVPTYTGAGYWLILQDASIDSTRSMIEAHGDAVLYYDNVTDPFWSISGYEGAAASASHPSDYGFWAVSEYGFVYSYGACLWYGNIDTQLLPGEKVVAIRPSDTGLGYHILGSYGTFASFGDATTAWDDSFYQLSQNERDATQSSQEGYLEEYVDFSITDAYNGGYILKRSGEIFPFGEAIWFGNMIGLGFTRSDGNYCVDTETEILTKRGWLRYDEVKEGDYTIGLDPDGSSKWVEVKKISTFEVEEEPMLRMNRNNINSLSTLNHRWLTLTKGDQWQWHTSDSLCTSSLIPITAADGDLFPVESTYSDDFVELIAWFWTEGSFGTHDGSDFRACLSQSRTHNPSLALRIEALLTRLYGPHGMLRNGFMWHKYERPQSGVNIYRLKSTIRDELLNFVSLDKVPTYEFLNGLTKDQAQLFVDISIMADGHTRPDGYRCFTQKSEERLDAFHNLCIRLGIPCRKTVIPNGFSVSLLQHKGFTRPFLGKDNRSIEPYSGVIWCPTTDNGTWLARRNGTCYITGNSDYSDIIKDLLLWSGWYLYETSPDQVSVFGGIESTGAHAGEAPIGADFFDKKPVIDPINALKEIVGYIFYIDQDGGAIFRSPNWWAIGNFDQDGQKISYIPEIDERNTLLEYSVGTTDEQSRSEIIIGDTKPEDGNFTTRVTRVIPPSANLLRGMIKPAIWTNEAFMSSEEQRIMAELISLHIWFQRRQGNVTAVGNPCIMPDDQVRIYERTTGESYVHYVRGISTTMNLDTGDYRMNLTTHWLGESDDWVITRDGLLTEDGFRIDVSSTLIDAVRGYTSANAFAVNGPSSYTISSNVEVVDEEGGGPGA